MSGVAVVGGRSAMGAYDHAMRRGWTLLSVIVLLLITGAVGWWWSTPGQLWWMTKKWEWWVLPSGDGSPGGLTPDVAAYRLEPQWSRLLERQVVTPYRRTWPPPDDQRLEQFLERLWSGIHQPFPSELSGYAFVVPQKDGVTVRSGTEGASPRLVVELLLPPDQHDVVTRIAKEILGNDGQPLTDETPSWWLPPQ